MISYEAMMGSLKLMAFDCHAKPKVAEQDGGANMAQISWDEALASSGFVKIESEKRKVLVAKNPVLENKEKFGEMSNCLTMDVVEEDGVEVEKIWEVSSKRLLRKLRPLFEGVEPDTEVRFSIKRLGDRFDTSYDIEKLE